MSWPKSNASFAL